jgi:uncharacterized UPF0146 family protein
MSEKDRETLKLQFDSGFIFQDIRRKARERFGTNEVPIRGIWLTRFCCQPSPEERTFSGYLLVVQSRGQGVCLSDFQPQINFAIIGDNAFDHIRSASPISIALLDSLYDDLEDPPGHFLRKVSGDPAIKAQVRATIIADETARLVEDTGGVTVVLIGFVRHIARQLVHRGFRVVATDQSPAVVGKSFDGIAVDGSQMNNTYLRMADIAIVTGMTLTTNTIDGILETASKYGTKLLFFAQTGANLAKEYLAYGADTVVAEPFPLYDFHGESRIRIYRRGTGTPHSPDQ